MNSQIDSLLDDLQKPITLNPTKKVREYTVDSVYKILSGCLLNESDGIYIDLDNAFSIKIFFNDLKKIVSSGIYVKGINYKLIQEVFFEGKQVEGKMKIGDKLEYFNEAEQKIYSRKSREKGGKVLFEFTDIHIDEENTDIPVELDKIISTLISKGYVYGYNFDKIEEVLSLKPQERFNIREYIIEAKEVENGEDAYLDYLINCDKVLKPIIDEKTKKADMKRYECSFPQISELDEDLIAKKVPATLGKKGISIRGDFIDPKPGDDIDLESYSGEGTEIIKKPDGFEYIRATQTGFIYKTGAGKINITLNAKNKETIGVGTGIIEVLDIETFEQLNDIQKTFGIIGNNIVVRSNNMEGFIESVGGFIKVSSNVNGGQIKNIDGDIEIKGRVFSQSRIESLKGTVIVDIAENSTIIGNNIKIRKATNCTIIGNNVEIVEGGGNNIHSQNINIANNRGNISKDKKETTRIFIPINSSDKLRQEVISYEEQINLINEQIIKKEDFIKDLLENELNKQAYSIAVKLKQKTITKNNLDIALKRKVEYLERHYKSDIEPHIKELGNLKKQLLNIFENINTLNSIIESIETLNQQNINIKVNNKDNSNTRVYYYLLDKLDLDEILNSDNIETIINVTKGIFPADSRRQEEDIKGIIEIDYEKITRGKEFNENDINFGGERVFHRCTIFDKCSLHKQLNSLDPDVLIKPKINKKWDSIAYDISFKGIGMFIKNDINIPVAIKVGQRLTVSFEAFGMTISSGFTVKWSSEDEKGNLLLGGTFTGIDHDTESNISQITNRLQGVINKKNKELKK